MKKKKRFSKVIVSLVLGNVFVYVWVHLILSAVVGSEIAPTVSVAFLGFCGCEAGILGMIKKWENEESGLKKRKSGRKKKGDDTGDENGFTEADEP